MSRAEALQLQLDTAQRDKQQLEAENARLREDSAVLADVIAERDELRLENQRLRAETLQLGAVYDQLLKDSREEHQMLEDQWLWRGDA